ncbi:MAG: amidase family protein [Pseudomonadota bacterium]|nr:amidase family protein [Pseudomonadota bacterium]
MIAEYLEQDATGLAAMVAKGDVSAAELTECAIERIEALNPRLNAVVWKRFDEARAEAARSASGPFAGVPFLLKDSLGDLVGAPTRQGSAFEPATPKARNSTLTDRFLAAGLNPLGKTNVPEFALMTTTESRLYGPARNPWNAGHITGGSSGGSAAAVASGMVPVAHANDGGGSIRIPASCCGLVGLKPTRARTSIGPVIGDGWGGLEVEHVVSRSVRDTAAMLDATSGPAPGDPYCAPPAPPNWREAAAKPPGTLRIALIRTRPDGSALHPDCLAAVDHTASLCTDLGHQVEEVDPVKAWQMGPERYASFGDSYGALYASSLVSQIDTITAQTGQVPSPDNLEAYTLALYEMGKGITGGAYQQAWAYMHRLGREMADWHANWDVALTPTLAQPPLTLGTLNPQSADIAGTFAIMTDFSSFTGIQNSTGQPALTLPLHWNAAGLPIGTQLVGRFGEEALLLQLATQLEAAAPWEPRCRAMRSGL